MLEVGKALDEADTTFVDEECWRGAVLGITQAAQDFGPAGDPLGVGLSEVNAEVTVLLRDSEAVALDGKAIVAGGKETELIGIQIIAVEHGADGAIVAVGEPETSSVLVDDVHIAVGVFRAQENDGVVPVTVIHGGEPFGGEIDVELGNDVDVATEGGEELAGSDVPVAMQPGALLPAGEAIENAGVFGVYVGVIGDGGGDEDGGR